MARLEEVKSFSVKENLGERRETTKRPKKENKQQQNKDQQQELVEEVPINIACRLRPNLLGSTPSSWIISFWVTSSFSKKCFC